MSTFSQAYLSLHMPRIPLVKPKRREAPHSLLTNPIVLPHNRVTHWIGHSIRDILIVLAIVLAIFATAVIRNPYTPNVAHSETFTYSDNLKPMITTSVNGVITNTPANSTSNGAITEQPLTSTNLNGPLVQSTTKH